MERICIDREAALNQCLSLILRATALKLRASALALIRCGDNLELLHFRTSGHRESATKYELSCHFCGSETGIKPGVSANRRFVALRSIDALERLRSPQNEIIQVSMVLFYTKQHLIQRRPSMRCGKHSRFWRNSDLILQPTMNSLCPCWPVASLASPILGLGYQYRVLAMMLSGQLLPLQPRTTSTLR